MERLIYKCDPANQDKLHCIHLKVMNAGNKYCCHRTKQGHCARFNDRQMKEVVDKLGHLEERGCSDGEK